MILNLQIEVWPFQTLELQLWFYVTVNGQSQVLGEASHIATRVYDLATKIQYNIEGPQCNILTN